MYNTRARITKNKTLKSVDIPIYGNGVMHNGEIIDRGKSIDLINKHGRKNLEEVFLKIVRE